MQIKGGILLSRSSSGKKLVTLRATTPGTIVNCTVAENTQAWVNGKPAARPEKYYACQLNRRTSPILRFNGHAMPVRSCSRVMSRETRRALLITAMNYKTNSTIGTCFLSRYSGDQLCYVCKRSRGRRRQRRFVASRWGWSTNTSNDSILFRAAYGRSQTRGVARQHEMVDHAMDE